MDGIKICLHSDLPLGIVVGLVKCDDVSFIIRRKNGIVKLCELQSFEGVIGINECGLIYESGIWLCQLIVELGGVAKQ